MREYVGNLHNHTTFSDGMATHDVVAAAAIRAGLDFMVFTDHNVWAHGLEGYYQNRHGQRVLGLVGEEVHDTTRCPQCNHLLVYGADQRMAPYAQAQSPQALIDAVNDVGGHCFIAHPIDKAVPWAGEPPIPWESWDVSGYTGLELWNYMSMFKTLVANLGQGLRSVYDPKGAMVGPDPATLALWDGLLVQGKRVPVIGNADAHATIFQVGPLRKVVFPYEFLFRCVNTHVLLEHELSGDPFADSMAIYDAIAKGRAFVGYGVPGNPRGFRFEAYRDLSATDAALVAMMGDAIPLSEIHVLKASAPAEAELRLICNGQVVATRTGNTLIHQLQQPGAYRVEAWKTHRGRKRGWIFSNPIYVLDV